MPALPTIAIRRANRGDLHAITVLAAKATRILCSPDYSADQIESTLRFALAGNAQMIDDRTCFLIETAGRPIAVGGWSYRAALMGNANPDFDGDPREILDPIRHPARLRGFCVHPAFARKGLARTLVALCERAAANAGFSALELLATPTARHLYRACGFTDLHPLAHRFPNGIAVLTYRMAKSIQPANVSILADSQPYQSRIHARVPVTLN
jgi:ribosomal protein S18 acetylase RimI-like enzyme